MLDKVKEKIKNLISEDTLRIFIRFKQYLPSEVKKDLLASSYIKKNMQKRKQAKIKVAFIVQMAEIWDKEAPIYDAMRRDKSFQLDMIVVPEYDIQSGALVDSYNNNFFLDNYPEAICALCNNTWVDLEKSNYDYTFLQRPYDQYLPRGFRSTDLVKHTKVCYIPYGYSPADVFNEGNTNKVFFRNVYFSFLESSQMANLLGKKFILPAEKHTHKVMNLGYPALIPYFDLEKSSNAKKILWTPRWSFDPIIGKSNFLKYKELFVTLVDDNEKINFSFRPHPLLMGELASKGLMSELEVNAYIQMLEGRGVEYDIGRPIIDSFKDTDILITDLSSIIIQFFITGRPIIYCEAGFELNTLFAKLSEGFYIANNEEDIKKYTELLLKGDDPLREKRRRLIEEELMFHRDSTTSILEVIREDCKQ